jgi:phage repressor protein C with HTH and peptisase S24 domain
VVDEEKVLDSLAFSSLWLKRKLGIAAENLYLINVEGESMEPTLRQGNVILVNHADNTVTRDGIYALKIGDSVLVKRLQRLPNSIVKVTSDNPVYQPFDIDLSDNSSSEISIIGRAVWFGQVL